MLVSERVYHTDLCTIDECWKTATFVHVKEGDLVPFRSSSVSVPLTQREGLPRLELLIIQEIHVDKPSKGKQRLTREEQTVVLVGQRVLTHETIRSPAPHWMSEPQGTEERIQIPSFNTFIKGCVPSFMASMAEQRHPVGSLPAPCYVPSWGFHLETLCLWTHRDLARMYLGGAEQAGSSSRGGKGGEVEAIIVARTRDWVQECRQRHQLSQRRSTRPFHASDDGEEGEGTRFRNRDRILQGPLLEKEQIPSFLMPFLLQWCFVENFDLESKYIKHCSVQALNFPSPPVPHADRDRLAKMFQTKGCEQTVKEFQQIRQQAHSCAPIFKTCCFCGEKGRCVFAVAGPPSLLALPSLSLSSAPKQTERRQQSSSQASGSPLPASFGKRYIERRCLVIMERVIQMGLRAQTIRNLHMEFEKENEKEKEKEKEKGKGKGNDGSNRKKREEERGRSRFLFGTEMYRKAVLISQCPLPGKYGSYLSSAEQVGASEEESEEESDE